MCEELSADLGPIWNLQLVQSICIGEISDRSILPTRDDRDPRKSADRPRLPWVQLSPWLPLDRLYLLGTFVSHSPSVVANHKGWTFRVFSTIEEQYHTPTARIIVTI